MSDLSLKYLENEANIPFNIKVFHSLCMSFSHKSREIWLKEGDKNMSFLHRMANSHIRWNTMFKIKINWVWLTEEA